MGGRGGGPNSSALGQALKEAAAPAAQPSAVDQIIDAMSRATRKEVFGGKMIVGMFDLREQLSALGWNREKQDAELIKASRQRKLILAPYTNQKVLIPRDREAALRLGGENKGLVMEP